MFLIIDTETTGINKATARAVQIAWALCDSDGRTLNQECHIVRPDGFSIPAGAEAIHHISTERARREGIPLSEILQSLSSDANNATCLVAHNISYDVGILKREYHEAGIPYPFVDHSQRCTMMSSVNHCRLPKLNGRGGFKRPKLDELHWHLFNEYFPNAHDALGDVLACKRCFFELQRLGVIADGEISTSRTSTVQRPNKRYGAEVAASADVVDLKQRRQQVDAESHLAIARQKTIDEKEKLFAEKEAKIRNQYEQILDSASDPGAFWVWWFCCFCGTLYLLFWIFPTLRDGNAGFLPVTIVSLILTFILRGRSREKKENSADYIAIARQRDHAIDSIRNPSSSEQSGSPGRLSAPPNHSHSQFSPSPSTHQASPVAAKATHSEKCTGCGGILWSYEHGLCANCRKTSSTVESQAEPIDRPFAQHIDPSINNLMRKHGVTKDGVQYLWKGCRFSSSNKLVEALMQYERTRSRN